jgi:c-di-GMP-binding flagellar brake protein YcgR
MMYRFNDHNDRRRFQRLELNLNVFYKVDLPVYVKLWIGDREVEATTLNISEGGMAFLTSYDIPLASVLMIKFSLFKVNRQGEVDFSKPVEISGEVRSNDHWEGKEYRLGICFIRKDEEVKTQLSDFVKSAS